MANTSDLTFSEVDGQYQAQLTATGGEFYVYINFDTLSSLNVLTTPDSTKIQPCCEKSFTSCKNLGFKMNLPVGFEVTFIADSMPSAAVIA